MNATISMDALYNFLKSLSLGVENERWLADKLYEDIEEKEEEHLTPYTMEELNARIDQAIADVKAGRTISSEEAHRQMKEYIGSSGQIRPAASFISS